MPAIKAPDSQQHAGIGMPTVYIRRVTLGSADKGLGAEIELVVKDMFRNQDALNAGFLKYLKIHVYQSLDPDFDNLVKSKSKNIYLAHTNNLVKRKTISVFDYLSKDIETKDRDFARFKDANGLLYEDFVYKVRFSTEQLDPSHLSYYTQAEIDMSSVVEEERINSINASSAGSKICGKLTGESIIKSGRVVRESTFYSIDSPVQNQIAGSIWAGPVHLHPEKGYMSGAKHLNIPHASLKTQSIINPKILDMRGVKPFEEKKFIFDSDQQYESSLPKDYRNIPIRHDNQKNYFSDLFVTKNEDSAVSLTFSFNHLGYIQDNSRFRDLASVSSQKQSFLLNFPVIGVKVIRHQLNTNKQEIIMDTSSGNTLRHNYIWPPVSVKGQNKISTTLSSKSNSLEMINVTPDNSIKTWTIVDNDSMGLSNGKYRYEAILTVEDRTLKILETTAIPLERHIQAMRSYEEHAFSEKNYNSTHNQFNESFRKEAQKLGWSEAIAGFAAVVESLYGPDYEDLIDNMIALSNPASGTPAGITHVIATMLDLRSQINKALGAKTRPSSSNTKSLRVGAKKGGLPKTEIKVMFDEIYDGEFSNNGLMYLNEKVNPKNKNKSLAPQNIKKITQSQYGAILRSQRDKYFSSGAKSNTKSILKDLVKSAPSISSTFLSDVESVETLYLTPTKAKAGDRLLDLINQGEKLYDVDNYSAFTAELLNLSGQTKYIKTKNNEKKNKEFSQLVDGIFASNGISIDFSLLDRNKQKDVVREIVGSTKEDQDDLFSDTFDVLQNSKFSKENIRNSTKTTYSVEEYDERKNLTNELGKELLSSLATDSRGELENRKDRSGFKLSLSKLDPEKNVDLLNPQKARRISKLPMPILSLIFSRAPVVRKNWHDLDIDILQDSNYTEFYRYNYDLVVKVQYLDGYTKANGKSQLKDPVWRDLTSAGYKSLSLMGHPVLCRIERHEDGEYGLGQTKNLDVPIYNKYFIIEPEQALPSATTDSMSRAQQVRGKVNKFINAMSPQITDYARTITIDHSDMFRTK